MLAFLWVYSFFGHSTTDTFPFLDNDVTISAKHYHFWILCSYWWQFSKYTGGKFAQHLLLSPLLKQHHLCSQLPLTLVLLLISPHWEMEITVQNNCLLFSVSFTEDTAWISIRDLSNGLYESVVTLLITVWHIIERQRQQFDIYHQGQFPITENQLVTHAMGHEVVVISGHHYPIVNGTHFPDN